MNDTANGSWVGMARMCQCTGKWAGTGSGRRLAATRGPMAHGALDVNARLASLSGHSPGGATGAGSWMRPWPVIEAMICLPWKRPFSMKISEVFRPPTTTPAR